MACQQQQVRPNLHIKAASGVSHIHHQHQDQVAKTVVSFNQTRSVSCPTGKGEMMAIHDAYHHDGNGRARKVPVSFHTRSSSLIVNPNFDNNNNQHNPNFNYTGSNNYNNNNNKWHAGDYRRSQPLARQRRTSQSLTALRGNNSFNSSHQASSLMTGSQADKRLRLDSAGYDLDDDLEDGDHNSASGMMNENWRPSGPIPQVVASSQRSVLACLTGNNHPLMGIPSESDFEQTTGCHINNEQQIQGPEVEQRDDDDDDDDESTFLEEENEQELAMEATDDFRLPDDYHKLSLSRQNLFQFRMTGLYLRRISQDFVKSRRKTI